MATSRQKLEFLINANSRKFERKMGRVKSIAKTTAAAVASTMGVGLGIAGAVAGTKKLIDNLDGIGKMSKRLGISTDFAQKLGFAGERVGTNAAIVENGVKRMQKNILDAEMGMTTAIRGFERLGLTFDDLKGKKPEEQFKMLVSALNQVEDATEKSALAQTIFGRSGQAMIPILNEFNDLSQELEDKGAIISEEQIKAAEEFKDAMTNLGTSIQALVGESGLVSWLNNIANALSEIGYNSAELKKLANNRTVKGGDVTRSELGFWNYDLPGLFYDGAVKPINLVKQLGQYGIGATADLLGDKELANYAYKESEKPLISGWDILDLLHGIDTDNPLEVSAPGKFELDKSSSDKNKRKASKEAIEKAAIARQEQKEAEQAENFLKLKNQMLDKEKGQLALLELRSRYSDEELKKKEIELEYAKKIKAAKESLFKYAEKAGIEVSEADEQTVVRVLEAQKKLALAYIDVEANKDKAESAQAAQNSIKLEQQKLAMLEKRSKLTDEEYRKQEIIARYKEKMLSTDNESLKKLYEKQQALELGMLEKPETKENDTFSKDFNTEATNRLARIGLTIGTGTNAMADKLGSERNLLLKNIKTTLDVIKNKEPDNFARLA